MLESKACERSEQRSVRDWFQYDKESQWKFFYKLKWQKFPEKTLLIRNKREVNDAIGQ